MTEQQKQKQKARLKEQKARLKEFGPPSLKQRTKKRLNSRNAHIVYNSLLGGFLIGALLVVFMGAFVAVFTTYQIMADQGTANIPPAILGELEITGVRDHFIFYASGTATSSILLFIVGYIDVCALGEIITHIDEPIIKKRKEG